MPKHRWTRSFEHAGYHWDPRRDYTHHLPRSFRDKGWKIFGGLYICDYEQPRIIVVDGQGDPVTMIADGTRTMFRASDEVGLGNWDKERLAKLRLDPPGERSVKLKGDPAHFLHRLAHPRDALIIDDIHKAFEEHKADRYLELHPGVIPEPDDEE